MILKLIRTTMHAEMIQQTKGFMKKLQNNRSLKAEDLILDKSILNKEYISVIEGTAPVHPPSSSKHLTLPTSPRAVCSILHYLWRRPQYSKTWSS